MAVLGEHLTRSVLQPVREKVEAGERLDLARIGDLSIYARAGVIVPLDALVPAGVVFMGWNGGGWPALSGTAAADFCDLGFMSERIAK